MSTPPDASAPIPSDSTPPPGAEEAFAQAGVPEGGLTGGEVAAGGRAEVPDDASDNRGKHFNALIRSPGTMILTSVLVVGGFIAGSIAANPAIGGAIAGGVVVVTLIVIFALATSRAADDFYTAYAEGRGLTRVGEESSLPPVTALLRKGDRRYTEEIFNGNLPGGLAGSLALFTYEQHTRDSKGNRQTTYYHFTVAVARLPGTAPFMSEMALQRRLGFRFLDSAEDAFRTRQRVELESEVADKKFEIFIGRNDDMVKARQIYSPSFIIWLAEEAHEGIAFELVAGALVVNIKGHMKTARELDAFCEAAAVVAQRLDEEARE